MKMIIAIVQDDDAGRLINSLMKEGISVTKLATTGGFLRSGNTTLLTGTADEKVQNVLATIEKVCKSRKQVAPLPTTDAYAGAFMGSSEIVIGGATVFVLSVDSFVKY